MTKLLRTPAVACLSHALLTLPFWFSGLSKLLFFDTGVAEMARAGVQPSAAFNVATFVVQLVGSALIILNRGAWLGSGALGSFTALPILLVHRFWAIADEPFRTIAMHVSTEHLGMIGGLLCVAVLAVRQELPERAPYKQTVYGRPQVRR
jgi:transmembrane protein